MKLLWGKWGLTFWRQLGQHIGTAGLSWLALSATKDGSTLKARDLWISVLVGGVLPTVFTFFKEHPTPDVEDENDSVQPKSTVSTK